MLIQGIESIDIYNFRLFVSNGYTPPSDSQIRYHAILVFRKLEVFDGTLLLQVQLLVMFEEMNLVGCLAEHAN